ncbi:MAG: ATP-binding protein [bacterium]|nr:ATP-binding protein [bacterium]
MDSQTNSDTNIVKNILDEIESLDASKSTIDEMEDLLEKIGETEVGFYKRADKLRKKLSQEVSKRKRKLARGIERAMPKTDREASGLPLVPVLEDQDKLVGDVNLIMANVPYTSHPFDKIMTNLAQELIKKTGGLTPNINVQAVRDKKENEDGGQRFIVKWISDGPLSPEQLSGLHYICEQAYERRLKGHKADGTGWENVVKRHIGLDGKMSSDRAGLYFGMQTQCNLVATGLIVSRKFIRASEAKFLIDAYPDDWIARTTEIGHKIVTEVELREGVYSKEMSGLSQENLLYLIVQVSYLLAKKRLIDRPTLMTAIFRELGRVGTSAGDREKLYGMRSVLEVIERVLLMPLQHPELASYYKIIQPESVLLVGAPGVGKTLLVHWLMARDYNAIFVDVDSDRLYMDLKKGSGQGASEILLRIDAIKSMTRLPVIILIDEVDKLFEEKGDMVVKFLNLTQGIRTKGFHIIASTNYPEKIDMRLLEPGRISRTIYVGLPNEVERKGVLAVHLNDIPFEDESIRLDCVETMTRMTIGWTQRQLWFLCVEAAKLCGFEIAGANILTKDLVTGRPLRMDDLKRARVEVLKSINMKDIKDWDKRIQRFVSQLGGEIGFKSTKKGGEVSL